MSNMGKIMAVSPHEETSDARSIDFVRCVFRAGTIMELDSGGLHASIASARNSWYAFAAADSAVRVQPQIRFKKYLMRKSRTGITEDHKDVRPRTNKGTNQ